MKRTLHLDLYPYRKAQQLTSLEVLTPNPRAALALGVKSRSLADLAGQILTDGGLGVATPLDAQLSLQSVVRELFKVEESYSTARTLAPALQKLIRSGTDLDLLEQAGSKRARRLAQLAKSYKSRLRQAGLIDPDEA